MVPGTATLNTYLGSICTFLCAISLLAYSSAKVLAWHEPWANVTSTVTENFYDTSFQFEASEWNFFMAFALTNYDSSEEVEEDRRYGQLVFKQSGWGNGVDISLDTRVVESHFCSDEELGITRSEKTKIYPWIDGMEKEVMTWRRKFRCATDPNIKLWGDYNSPKAQTFKVDFEKCTGKDYCKSEAEIRDWLRQKFIVLIYNQVRFNPEGYGEQSVIRESRIHYIPVNTQVREMHRFQVSTYLVDL